MSETRRNHLKIIGAVGATCAFPFSADELYAQHEHVHEGSGAPPPVAPFAPVFFTAEEGRVVAQLADLIIPPTDSPGAVQAGVPQYIDGVVSQNAEQQKLFRDGIAWVEGRSREAHDSSFLELAEDGQVELLTYMQDNRMPFFAALKSLTADGYYTSYAGLVRELGYKGNQVLASFEGCVHEH
jgi:hypothetical protein